MKPRPKHTRPDANQPDEHDKLREYGCTVIDVHNLPGNETANPLDAFVMSLGGVWIQVEWKVKPGSPITDNEQAYFEHLGIWDAIEARILEPLAQVRQHGKMVVVAWEAMQIMDVFAFLRLNAGNRRGVEPNSSPPRKSPRR